jgi:hypothetical protein
MSSMTNGMMTPESLSREASPGLPTGAHGIPEIQLQDVPTQQVALASHHMTEVKTHPGNSVNPAVLTARFPGLPTNVLNCATVLTTAATGQISGQPGQIQLTGGGVGGPQKLIVTGQPRLIVPACQLLSNGANGPGGGVGVATIGTSATVTPLSKPLDSTAIINPGRQILQSLSGTGTTQALTLQPHQPISSLKNEDGRPQPPRIETHKIISGPIGIQPHSGTPIILQTALTTLP